ncbi:MAG: hypothetical protein GY941_21530 [Planctomycetes bacterium]|nr:hypothetical protein [Planctomycetota bacterium]
MKAIGLIQKDVHATALQKGWWEGRHRSTAECIALMHSELSEALEAARYDNPTDEHCGLFGNLEVELADCIIRIMDFCEHAGLNLADALVAKAEYNKDRDYKHGGKKF